MACLQSFHVASNPLYKHGRLTRVGQCIVFINIATYLGPCGTYSYKSILSVLTMEQVKIALALVVCMHAMQYVIVRTCLLGIHDSALRIMVIVLRVFCDKTRQ